MESDAVPLKEHLEALRQADDRRYAEVAAERDKALKIKEAADEKALQLAAQIQTYKDEKANELREQINKERSLYITRDQLDAAVKEIKTAMVPLQEAQALTRGSNSGQKALLAISSLIVGLVVGLIGVYTFLQPDPVTVAPSASTVNIKP